MLILFLQPFLQGAGDQHRELGSGKSHQRQIQNTNPVIESGQQNFQLSAGNIQHIIVQDKGHLEQSHHILVTAGKDT